MFKRKINTDNNRLKTTLEEPQRALNIPEKAQWLAGEGAGSWFFIEQQNGNYQITRFNPKGDVECQAIFQPNTDFNINRPFEFTYLSHCSEINILQNGTKITFLKK